MAEQIIDGSYVIADMLQFVASLFDRVTVRGVCGNHPRTRTTTLNGDYLLYHTAMLLLKEQKNVEFLFTDAPFMLWEEEGINRRNWKFLICHGDDIRGYMGIPYYGLQRAQHEFTRLTDHVVDATIFGHHHRYAEIEGGLFINGSWQSGTGYSVKKMRAASQATQGMLFHHPEVGWTSRWPIYLTPKPGLEKPDDTGTYTVYESEESLSRKISEVAEVLKLKD
jgi:hypothetical protein